MPVYIFFKTLTCRLFDRGHGGQRNLVIPESQVDTPIYGS